MEGEHPKTNNLYVTHSISPPDPCVKIIANNYGDTLFFIITQNNKMGSVIEVLKEGELDDFEIDVNLLSGAGQRSESYLEVVRALAEIFLKQTATWAGKSLEPRMVSVLKKILEKKKVIFAVCLNKEETQSEESTISPDTVKIIIEGFRGFLSNHCSFFIN